MDKLALLNLVRTLARWALAVDLGFVIRSLTKGGCGALLMLILPVLANAEDYWVDAEMGPWVASLTYGVQIFGEDAVDVARAACEGQNKTASNLEFTFVPTNDYSLRNSREEYNAICEMFYTNCTNCLINPNRGGQKAWRYPLRCPYGHVHRVEDSFVCRYYQQAPPCDCLSACSANPINIETGAKRKFISLYKDRSFSLGLNYTHSPASLSSLRFGLAGWRLSYLDQRLQRVYDRAGHLTAYLYVDETGSIVRLSSVTEGQGIVARGRNGMHAKETADGFELNAGPRTLSFDRSGVFKGERSGMSSITVQHEHSDYRAASSVVRIRNQMLKEIVITYDSEKPKSIELPDGTQIDLQYTDGNLTSVTGGGHDLSFSYVNTSFPKALTGLSSGAGEKKEIYAYDASGRAIRSELQGGAGSVSVSYLDPLTRVVTNALGKETVYKFVDVDGERRLKSITGEPTQHCAQSEVEYIYDDSGNIEKKIENSVATQYQYDGLNRQISRTEAAGTPEARTISTEYHSTLNLPVKVTEPGRVTTYTYDVEGRLTSQKTQSTTAPW